MRNKPEERWLHLSVSSAPSSHLFTGSFMIPVKLKDFGGSRSGYEGGLDVDRVLEDLVHGTFAGDLQQAGALVFK